MGSTQTGGIIIVVGGVIPPSGLPTLIEAGAAAVFGPGTNIPKAAAELIGKLNEKMGYASVGKEEAE